MTIFVVQSKHTLKCNTQQHLDTQFECPTQCKHSNKAYVIYTHSPTIFIVRMCVWFYVFLHIVTSDSLAINSEYWTVFPEQNTIKQYKPRPRPKTFILVVTYKQTNKTKRKKKTQQQQTQTTFEFFAHSDLRVDWKF